ncbi:LpqB family beta-propeller domain-containing protein [Ruania zhangjianzhongii]|uniref:LpqB family beta-propeller domain-containing protein n=1 Tax=Ruania zhangjianzhongii TaxID=2603206 RepID=UPI0016525326|nr:LpqB family beta-propeller domain-containing protein [Ruania zhangjianzhongii]
MNRSPRLLAALTALALMAGCASLPTDGAVQPGVEAGQEEGVGYVVAADPQRGAGPDEIVRGFQSAAVAGNGDEFTTARKFLTDSTRSDWDPAAQVVIYDGSVPLSYDDSVEGTVEVEVTVVATVDSDGIYTQAAPGTSSTMTYTVVQDASGEWRISGLPDGVLMSEVNFGTLYRKTAVYFLSADGSTLVPDLRWYPLRNRATYAVRGLLAGAAEWLSPAVISAIPDGTELSIDSVTVSGGTANVPLTSAVQTASADDRALLVAQLEQTLTALPQVQGVEVTVGDVPLEVSAATPDLAVDPGVGRTLTVLNDENQLATYNGAELTPVPDAVDLGSLDPADPAVGYSSDQQTVLLAGGSQLLTAASAEAEATVLLEGQNLLPPSYAPDGWIWTGEQQNSGELLIARAEGNLEAIETPTLAGMNIRALRVSRDGARLAMIVDSDGSVQVMVHAITIDADGTPTGIGPGVRVGRELSDASDVVWVDETQLGVLGVSQATQTVHVVEVGGRTTPLPSVADTVRIASGRGVRDLYLATEDGGLYGRSGNGWAPVISGVRFPTFPG